MPALFTEIILLSTHFLIITRPTQKRGYHRFVSEREYVNHLAATQASMSCMTKSILGALSHPQSIHGKGRCCIVPYTPLPTVPIMLNPPCQKRVLFSLSPALLSTLSWSHLSLLSPSPLSSLSSLSVTPLSLTSLLSLPSLPHLLSLMPLFSVMTVSTGDSGNVGGSLAVTHSFTSSRS